MIKVFNFDFYAFLDPWAILYFLTPYIALNFDILHEQILEPFSASTPICESILVKGLSWLYHFLNHKNTMIELDKLDMVDFDVILGIH